jgi:DNA-binding NtrC family response regulator
LELGEKGTIFLDDIEEIPLNLQARLLHILQEKQFFRVGGESAMLSDVRFIAATSADLEEALAARQLREDLYYRLSAFTLQVPPLRRRVEEIPQLLEHFMSQLSGQYALPPRRFPQALVEACQGYDWPGNLRELEGLIKRFLVMGDEPLLLSELRRNLETPIPDAPEIGEEPLAGLRSLVQSVKGEAEKNAITLALEETRWNRKAAARILKVSYRTLLYKIQQYRMSPPAAYAPAFSEQAVQRAKSMRSFVSAEVTEPHQ